MKKMLVLAALAAFGAAAVAGPTEDAMAKAGCTACHTADKKLVGVDVFLHWNEGTPDQLGEALAARAAGDGLKLVMVSNRGTKVWPGGMPETFCTDHWRCRFMAEADGGAVTHAQIIGLLRRVADAGFDFIKTENLCTFDGQPGYSLGQGQ